MLGGCLINDLSEKRISCKNQMSGNATYQDLAPRSNHKFRIADQMELSLFFHRVPSCAIATGRTFETKASRNLSGAVIHAKWPAFGIKMSSFLGALTQLK